MVALSRPESHTVGAIYAALAKSRQQYESHGLAIGQLGEECDARLWFAFRHAHDPEPVDGKKQRRFDTGNREEDRLIEDLERAGVKVMRRQEKVRAIGGHLRGKTDGVAQGVIEAPKALHVVECKATNDKRFKEIAVGVKPRDGGPIKQGCKTQAPSHYAQCQIYMHLLALKRCLYVLVNTNNDEIYIERIEYDPAFALKAVARAERIIRAEKRPSKISDDPDKYPCMLCPAKAVCFGEEFGRVNCRTCIHSTPIVDESDRGAWKCERFGRELSREEADKGCPAHLFRPDLVPGEQIDAGDDWVSYRLKDGREYRDGVKEAAE